MTPGGTLLLAGGGHSHALLLKRWAMRPQRRPTQNITLVNRSSTALYSGMVPGLIAGLYQRDDLAIDLRQLCERARVAFVEAEITGLNPEQNCLKLRDRPALRFDWLSLDVGAVSRPSAAGVPIKPLEASLSFLESEDPSDPNPLRVIGAGAAGSDHPQWIGIAWVFAFEKGKRGFQRFDGDPCGARPAHRSHIQAEPIEVECRAVAKVQKVFLRIQSGDFCFHESHPGSVTELPQVDGELVALIQPGDQPRNHA